MQMTRDRKAESIQAATVSSHSYEMLSSQANAFKSSDNKQVFEMLQIGRKFFYFSVMRGIKGFRRG